MYTIIIKILAVALIIMYGSLFYLAYEIINNTKEYGLAEILGLGTVLYITWPLFQFIFHFIFYCIFNFFSLLHKKMKKTPK